MFESVRSMLRRYDLISPGDRVTCAVSGGVDSMALLWCMYLLKDGLGIDLRAAHFNHGLRGAESDEDAAFVERFCRQFDIPLTVGRGEVKPGPKGLEAAARGGKALGNSGRVFPLWGVPRSPHQNKSSRQFVQGNH